MPAPAPNVPPVLLQNCLSPLVTAEALVLLPGCRVGSLKAAVLSVGVQSTLGLPAQARQTIISSPGSAWATKCQQVPGHTARNWPCWGTLVCLPPLYILVTNRFLFLMGNSGHLWHLLSPA